MVLRADGVKSTTLRRGFFYLPQNSQNYSGCPIPGFSPRAGAYQ